MAKKRGKNRRPSRGVKIGGGPIAGMLIPKFLQYPGSSEVICEIGVTGETGLFTLVNPPEEVSENNPPWVLISLAGVPEVVLSATYKVNGQLVIELNADLQVGATYDIGLSPNVKLLEPYAGMIFAGGAGTELTAI